ncbi:class I SAM-dependent methyltransferase [Caldalkalibacillus salinus]|uniref:class I SAM-dependent methyltransferase n=1 Tax=Caldalkalibacillus salinus TaxID=2803787 RepID=UPI0019205436|nr:class I SAM-dependent methyltransferase [Caldalkalibacillus salinus]
MLEYTGERVIPEMMKPTNGMLLEHIARYYFAAPYTKGRVLDYACGVGYGIHMVARLRRKETHELIGIDIDEDTIAYAQKQYYNPKINYLRHDVVDPDLPQQLGLFDTILSFETIEHVSEEEQFMHNIKQMLKPGGTLILSTPFGQGRGKPTNAPYHVHQLTEKEFKGLFAEEQNVTFYYQRGVTFENEKREGVRYPIGIVVWQKDPE